MSREQVGPGEGGPRVGSKNRDQGAPEGPEPLHFQTDHGAGTRGLPRLVARLCSPPVLESLSQAVMPRDFTEAREKLDASLQQLKGMFRNAGSQDTFLNGKPQRVKLTQTHPISPDTVVLRFALPVASMHLGLPVGNHLRVIVPNRKGTVAGLWNGAEDDEELEEQVSRKYTPISSNAVDVGFFDLLVKVRAKLGRGLVATRTSIPPCVAPRWRQVYRPSERWPDGGKVSQVLGALKVGSTITIQGPFGQHMYPGPGRLASASVELTGVKHLGMVAGGTGITPLYQVLKEVLRVPSDTTTVHLVFANHNEADILLRAELEALQQQHPTRFAGLWFTLSGVPATWTQGEGHVTEAMLQDHLPPPGPDTLVLACGPPKMIKETCRPIFKRLGYARDAQIIF